MKLVLLGPPGAGKGVQAVRICERFNAVHISTGDMLRDEISANTRVGRIAADLIHAGNLVPDELIIELMAQRLTQDDVAGGFVLDGFPRTLNQAMTTDLMTDLSLVINLVVDYALLTERVTGRRICSNCKHSCRAASSIDGLCPECGRMLETRDDDKADVLTARLEVHDRQVAPILEYYAEKGLLADVDSNGTIDECFANIVNTFAERRLV